MAQKRSDAILAAASGSPGLAILTRSPVPGRCKTRLIPLLGAEGAAGFHRALLLDVLSKAIALPLGIYLATTGPGVCRDPTLRQRVSSFKLLRQRGADLGERLENVFRQLLRQHSSVVVIGSDSPEISPRTFLSAFRELRWCEAVLGPCPDGGFYLLGLRSGLQDADLKALFRGIRWGSRWALADTLKNMASLRVTGSLIAPCGDVDRPRDLTRLFTQMSADPSLRRRAPETWRFLATHL
ncbi:MAG: TIGR04282 family arsenosugar biosynthesis glycosyltransferase [Terriglobia bacterium]